MSTRARPPGRFTWIAAFAVGALALATVGAGVAGAADPPPAPGTGSLCAEVGTDNPFTDVGPGAHQDTVLCLAAAGITTGTSATTYSPDAPVPRDQLASFVARAIDVVNALETADPGFAELPPADGDPFADVEAGNVHRSAISRLAGAGIVQGTAPGTFEPGAHVTRGQMASFVNQAEAFVSGEPFASTDDFFADDAGDVHEANVNGIASVGIATGKAPGAFAPHEPVTRAEMASFIVRWLAVHHAAGRIGPITPDSGADLLGIAVTDADGNGTLSTGDPIVLTYAAPVVVSSSITLTDESGTSVTLTDDTPTPPGATPATFTLAEDGLRLTVVPTGLVVFTGGDAFDAGPISVTDAAGIVDAESGRDWRPRAEPAEEVRFELERPAPPSTPPPADPDDGDDADAPDITDVDPAAGPEEGGNTVTIIGSGFAGAVSVAFGLSPATSITVLSDTEISVVVPGGTGTVDVLVGGPGGGDLLADAYTYAPVPTVSLLDPTEGPAAGGTSVTITGTGFTDDTEVTFDGEAATSVTVVSTTQLTATTPAGEAGAVDVVVSTPGGSATSADGFTYEAEPTLTSIDPDGGGPLGGEPLTITGTDLAGATAVTFGEVTLTDASFVVDPPGTSISLNAPASPGDAAGPVSVTVTTPGGTSNPLTYTYLEG